MKKYLITCANKKSADKVNDFIAVNSLFTEGETITEPVARCGSSYTDDDRIYNAVCAYIKEGGKDVKIYNINEFDYVHEHIQLCKDDEGRTLVKITGTTVYHVKVDDNSITVNGYKMKLTYKREYTFKLMKTYIGTYSPENLAHFIQNKLWKHSGHPENICEHVIAHGKKCA